MYIMNVICILKKKSILPSQRVGFRHVWLISRIYNYIDSYLPKENVSNKHTEREQPALYILG